MSALIPHCAASLYEADHARHLQVDAMLARVRQHDTSGCADFETDAPLFTRFELVVLTLVSVAAVTLFAASTTGMLP